MHNNHNRLCLVVFKNLELLGGKMGEKQQKDLIKTYSLRSPSYDTYIWLNNYIFVLCHKNWQFGFTRPGSGC